MVCTDLPFNGSLATANAAAVQLADGQCGLTDGSSVGDWQTPSNEDWESIWAPACGASGFALADRVGTGCASSGDTPFTNVPALNTRAWKSSSIDQTDPSVYRLYNLTNGTTFNIARSNANAGRNWAVRTID